MPIGRRSLMVSSPAISGGFGGGHTTSPNRDGSRHPSLQSPRMRMALPTRLLRRRAQLGTVLVESLIVAIMLGVFFAAGIYVSRVFEEKLATRRLVIAYA